MNHLLYADDLCIMCPSAKALQTLLDHCSYYATKHDILYNTKKSKCMVIIPKGFNNFMPPNVRLCNTILEYVTSYTYLGHIFRSDFSDDSDIEYQRRKLCLRANMLLRKFAFCSSIVKKCLFKTYCCNIYCCQLWASYTKSVFAKTRILFNNTFRWLMHYRYSCSASAMFAINGVPSFGEVLRKAVVGFRERITISQNVMLRTILSSDIPVGSMLHAAWNELLYIK